MPSNEFDVDSFLSDMASDGASSEGSEFDGTDNTGKSIVPFAEAGYEGKIDYRIRQLSYSSLLTLHSCPRKFQLYKLRTTHRSAEDETSTITFAFGHVVGEAIQLALQGKSESEIIWQMFLTWHADLSAVDTKADKSFWYAVFAAQKFLSLQQQGFLKEYELVYVDGKPAVELSFCINFPDGFRLRGFVDAVLRHRDSKEVIVLELKTTNAQALHAATYKNSAQAIGYSIVLDHLFSSLSSYRVLYLVYQTKSKEYTPLPFLKTFLQRALWIRELMLDIEMIKLYEEAEVYPMHGESCNAFFRECEYFNTCQLSTPYLTKPCTPDQEDKTEYMVDITLLDLLESQFKKAEEA